MTAVGAYVTKFKVGDLAGVWSIAYGTEDGNVLSAPNASLKPEYSDNFSLRATQYFEPVGLVAFGVFHNRIKDLIDTATLTPEEFGYDGDEPVDLVSTATNSAADITVNGYEFEFNHAMDYLPGPLSGLTLRGHFTNTNPSKKLSRVAQQVAGLATTAAGNLSSTQVQAPKAALTLPGRESVQPL